jgi:2-oxoglutarate ferredoxin oxidoreductase subunit gamma
VNGKKEIRLSGTGGQGIILGGIILAEGAIHDGKEVVQTQSYGPEARGGASKAEVIISNEAILYPKVIIPRYLLLMSQEAANLYAAGVEEDGIIVMDSSMIREMPEVQAKVIRIPITQLAVEEIGNALTANVLAVGALTAATCVVSKESMIEAVKARLPKVAAINTQAFLLGWEWGIKES